MVRSPRRVMVSGDDASSAAPSNALPETRTRLTRSSQRPVIAARSAIARGTLDSTTGSRANETCAGEGGDVPRIGGGAGDRAAAVDREAAFSNAGLAPAPEGLPPPPPSPIALST